MPVYRPRTEEEKQKISATMKSRGICGKVLYKKGHRLNIGRVPWNRGLIGWTRGTTAGFKDGNNLGNKNKGRRVTWGDKIARYGKEHFNWQGGKSFELYPVSWTKKFRELIRKRDNYVCQDCGLSQKYNGQRLSIHHIDRNKKNISYENLISLCRKCHGKTHWENKKCLG